MGDAISRIIHSQESRKLLAKIVPEFIDLWTGGNPIKKRIACAVQKSLEKGFIGGLSGSEQLGDIIEDPEFFKTLIEKIGHFRGSTCVRKAIEEFQPDIAICAHLHNTGGIEEHIGKTRVISVSRKEKIFEI